LAVCTAFAGDQRHEGNGMGYEVRIDRQFVASYPSSEEAVARVRFELRAKPDCEPEILDTMTGKPFAPASSRGWREQLANEVGY